MGCLRKGEAFPQVRRQSRTWDIAPVAEKCGNSRPSPLGRGLVKRGGQRYKNRRNEAGMYMKTKQNGKSALSLGERVAHDGVLTGRRGSGLRPPKGYAQSAYSIGYGPQAGEGSFPAHFGRN
jgi:hypothetical protein